jgi:hypothetical protein
MWQGKVRAKQEAGTEDVGDQSLMRDARVDTA